MFQSKGSAVLKSIRQDSSQESIREDEFYIRLQVCRSRYYSSVTLREHSEEDALLIFNSLIPELINLVSFVEQKEDAESSKDENIESFLKKAVNCLCNSIVETFKEAELTLTDREKEDIITQLYSDTDELLILLPRMFCDYSRYAANQMSKHKTISIFHTVFLLMVAAIFIVVSCLYFLMPLPLSLKAPETLAFTLKLEYLERPMKIRYLLKTFSGNLPKVIAYFDFYDKHKKLLSRLTYVLSGEGDHYNYSNQTHSEVNYITIFRNYNIVGKKQPVVFENILKDYNDSARRISAEMLNPSDVASVTANLQAWYDAGGGKEGDVSVSFYSWDKYVIN